MRALITGITGQDGYFLAKLLLEKGYEVFGFASGKNQIQNTDPLENLSTIHGDIAIQADITAAIESLKPDEIYNLASQSRPGESWNQVARTLSVNGLGAVNLFEAVR